MFLDATTRSVRAKTDAGATTTEPQFVTGFADTEATAFTPGTQVGNLNGTTVVKIIDEPATSSVRRQVKSINIYNADTVSHDITVYLYDDITVYTIGVFTVPAGKTLLYTYELGWVVIP